MENANANANEQSGTRSPSPSINGETQRENKERFYRLQNEMYSLKAMMEKVLEQRVRECGKQASNMVTGVNRTHRNNVQDYEE